METYDCRFLFWITMMILLHRRYMKSMEPPYSLKQICIAQKFRLQVKQQMRYLKCNNKISYLKPQHIVY